MSRETEIESEEASSEAERERDRALASFAAHSLDWPAVLELILPLAQSPLGRRALQELAPRTNPEASEALERAREMQAALVRGEEPPLAGLPDPVPEMELAHRFRRTMEGPELLNVARLLRVLADTQKWLEAREQEATMCLALFREIPDLEFLRLRLESTLDRHGKVLDSASPLLARIREAIAQRSARLDHLVREIAGKASLRAFFAEGTAGRVMQRGGRRVLAVRLRNAGQVPGIIHDRSQSGETIFVEPRAAVELGNALAASEAEEHREVSRVLVELTRETLAQRAELGLVSGRMAELELALISARFGRRYGGRPARLPGSKGAAEGLLLRSWRHPLLLDEVRLGHIEAVTPIDVRLGADFDLLVITGPNTGGKTLALKGAGLAVLMTRMGLSIPCDEGSTVPLFEGIAADIGDEQEIQQNLSTFSSHLVRIRAGLERANANILFLLDELGGGTDPSEGAALGEALLEALLKRRVPTLASTHLGKLKEFAFRHDRVENAHVEFDLATLAPCYTLIIGAPGQSRALSIAQRLGLPKQLLKRADELIEGSGEDVERMMQDMRGVRLEAERLRSEAEARVVELEAGRRALAQEGELLEARKAQLASEAERGIEERVAQIRPWLERGRGLMDQMEALHRARLGELLGGLEEALAAAAMTQRRADFLAKLKKGDEVWVPRFKKRCVVKRLYRDKGELSVRLGIAEMIVGFEDVTFYESL